jgi:hypothetical protein
VRDWSLVHSNTQTPTHISLLFILSKRIRDRKRVVVAALGAFLILLLAAGLLVLVLVLFGSLPLALFLIRERVRNGERFRVFLLVLVFAFLLLPLLSPGALREGGLGVCGLLGSLLPFS